MKRPCSSPWRLIDIPDILIGHDAESFRIPKDAEYWDVFGRKAKSSAPELRKHRPLLHRAAGLPLSSANSPKQLAYALLHAMIGHCALFTQAGYLHQDISEGTILLVGTNGSRRIPTLLDDIATSGDSVAVLIDGDAARQWGSPQEPSHRSGTKTFLSLRINFAWNNGQPYTHTPMDDLESFVWVLIFILLQRTVNRTEREVHWWTSLNCDNLAILGYEKEGLLNTWLCPEDVDIDLDAALSPPCSIFRSLLEEWLTLALRYKKRPPKTLAKIEEAARNAYREYIQAGLRCIPDLPDAWPTVPDSP